MRGRFPPERSSGIPYKVAFKRSALAHLHQNHRGTFAKCRFLGPSLDLLNKPLEWDLPWNLLFNHTSQLLGTALVCTCCAEVIIRGALLLSKASWIGLSSLFLLLRADTHSQQDKVPEVMNQDLPFSGAVGRASGSSGPLTNCNLGQYSQLPCPVSQPTLLGLMEPPSLGGWKDLTHPGSGTETPPRAA